jgi:hypothetical protein
MTMLYWLLIKKPREQYQLQVVHSSRSGFFKTYMYASQRPQSQANAHRVVLVAHSSQRRVLLHYCCKQLKAVRIHLHMIKIQSVLSAISGTYTLDAS